jgi:hypothetical protein
VPNQRPNVAKREAKIVNIRPATEVDVAPTPRLVPLSSAAGIDELRVTPERDRRFVLVKMARRRRAMLPNV